MGKKEQISSAMLFFSITCFIQSATSFTGYVAGSLQQEEWVSVVAGYLVSLPIAWIYLKLAELHPQKSLIQINECVFGSVLGKTVSILYVWFFFSLILLNASNVGFFVVNFIMPETPVIAVLAMFFFVCMWAVRCGVETITRLGALFVILIFLFIFFNDIMLIKEMNWNNFLPIFSLPAIKYIQATYTMAMYPLGEVIAFMMLFPYVDPKSDLKKPVYLGMLTGAMTVLLVIVKDTAVLGKLVSYLSLSTYEAIRLINIGNTLTKLEIFFICALIVMEFFKVSILLFAVTASIAQILRLKSYRLLVPSITVLAILFSGNIFSSNVERDYWGANIAMIYSSFFEVAIPVVLLSVAVIKKSVQKKPSSQSA